MRVDEHVAYLEADGQRLAEAAAWTGWDAPVPGTDWTVRELVTHVGGVHRWAADVVRTGAGSGDTDAGRAVGQGPPDVELLDWFRAGHGELVAALRAVPSDLDCFAFLPAPSPVAFWARRQAHETAVHRADAQGAAGIAPGFDVGFAQDGIDELVRGFARRRSNAIATEATLALRPTDGGASWLLTFGGEHIDAIEAPDVKRADAAVSGSSSELYLWLWNRPSPVEVSGDGSVAALWRNVRVRWS